MDLRSVCDSPLTTLVYEEETPKCVVNPHVLASLSELAEQHINMDHVKALVGVIQDTHTYCNDHRHRGEPLCQEFGNGYSTFQKTVCDRLQGVYVEQCDADAFHSLAQLCTGDAPVM